MTSVSVVLYCDRRRKVPLPANFELVYLCYLFTIFIDQDSFYMFIYKTVKINKYLI